MNNLLKFRAYSQFEKKMFYSHDDGNVFVLTKESWQLGEAGYEWTVTGADSRDTYTVYNEEKDAFITTSRQDILMQHIGLNDKHGVEIYWDDIIKCNDDICIIKSCGWETRCLMIEGHHKGSEFDIAFLAGQTNPIFQVIGNIHQNPELIK